MSHLLTVLGFALLPALGNFAGGLLAECWHTSKRDLNRALAGGGARLFSAAQPE